MLGVDLGWVILIGIFCGIFARIVAGPIWGKICGNKYFIPVPESVAKHEDIDESKLPKFWTIVGIILIPLVLIIANSVAKVVPALSGIQPVLAFLCLLYTSSLGRARTEWTDRISSDSSS